MTETSTNDPMQWWRDARFGMFIHWGLYAVPAGTWKDEQIPSLGEWIMRNAKIPIPEYEALSAQFDPIEFDADAWVALAKDAGMKYLVITSKHHDGFCMFDSPSNPYNIVDSTPFGRDIMAELAEACRTHDVRLGFYYSQAQDWHAPGGAGHWEEAEPGKDWHGYARPAEDFAAYLEAVVKPNVHELLTQYGPIGLIWFDTPVAITKEQSEALRDLVHELQPECLVSGRVGHDVGDYGSMGDNQIPVGRMGGDWETPATLNDTWGFKSYDHNWKSVDTLLYLLVDLASKGVNYLLNVGPTAEGLIPAPSVELLEAIGEWMDVNGEAIHGTDASPYPYELDWGRLTQKGDTLYLLIVKWPDGRLELPGLRSRIASATLLADPSRSVPFIQTSTDDGWHSLAVELSGPAPDPCVSVLRLELGGVVDVDDSPLQQPDGTLVLPAHMAEISGGVTIDRGGIAQGWTGTAPQASWQFRLQRSGRYRAEVLVGVNRNAEWVMGTEVRLQVAGHELRAELCKDRASDSPRAQYHAEAVCVVGEVEISDAGALQACLQATRVAGGAGLRLSEVRLCRLGDA